MRLLPCASLSLALLAAVPGDGAPPQLAEARSLLDGGKAPEALVKAKEGLERAPDLPELLDLASRAAAESGATDEALWYGALALEELAGVASPDKKEKAVAEAAGKRLVELDPLQQKGRTALTAYASALLAIGKDCAGRKLYVNAVDLLGRCRGTETAAAASAELAKIYGNKKAVEALLDSGLDVPIRERKKRSPEAIAKEDAKHSTWETAWEIKGDQYTIKTDMGLEIAQSMSLAMEQMNHFYRKVFHIKEHGGGQTARLTICVYKSREEFDQNEEDDGKPFSPGVKGFFSPNQNRVCTYDPRSERRSLAFLWSTLFHESSHQFTHLMAAGEVPTWLNEGTASYFEGAHLQPNGHVETNLVAEERLGLLKTILASGKPTLEELVTYFKPGSYPGEYYYPGWGLAYFLQNYEDEHSQRVYLKPYQDFMVVYGKSASKHDVMARFVEFFVTKPKIPGVESFADFEKNWKAWILKLHALYFGGPEVADELIARARKQVKDKAYESAEASFEWALKKRPGDPVASFELAELLAAQKKNDAAIYRYRAAVATLRTLEDPSGALPGSAELTGKDLLDVSEKQLAKLDKAFSEAKAKADEGFTSTVEAAAGEYAEKKLPLTSLRLLELSRALFGESSSIASLRAKIEKDSGADTRRWRRPGIEGDLSEWEAQEGWEAKEGALVGNSPEHPTFVIWREDLPERYTFEAQIDLTGLEEESGFLGVTFGNNPEGLQYAGFTADGKAEIGKFAEGWKPVGMLPSVKKEKLGAVTVKIEVFPESAEFFLDGKSGGKPKKYAREDLAGRLGFVVQGGKTTIRDVRVRY